MKRLASILFLLLLLGGLSAQEQVQFAVHHYSVTDGLSQNTVMAILQDRDGFMWFGTWDGLNRFDGYEFRSYKPTLFGQTPSSNRIDFLYEDSLGYLWMRTYSGGFYRLNKHTEHILSTSIIDTRSDISRPLQRFLVEAPKGEMWLAGGNNLLRVSEAMDGVKDDVNQTLFTLHGDINCLLSAHDGQLWAGTDKGIECFQADKRLSFNPGNSEKDNSILAACNDGIHLWFGAESGILWRFAPRSGRFTRIDLDVHSPITAIAEVDAFSLIITTEADGFVYFDKRSSTARLYNASNTPAIRDNCFRDLYVDSRACVWLVNEERGVLRFRPQDAMIKRYTNAIDERYKDQLTRNFIAFEDRHGNLWLNPQGGGFAVFDPQRDQLVSPQAGVTNMIHSAFMDDQGTLWLGTYDLGLDRLRMTPRQFILYDLRQDEQHPGELRAVCQWNDTTLVLATKDRRVRVFNQRMEYCSTLPVDARIYSLLPAANGDLWLGARSDGLFLYSNGKLSSYTADNQPYSLSCDDIYDLIYGPDSTLYVATFGGGVNIFREGRFIHMENEWTAYPEQFGARVRDLLFVNDTVLFAATTTGVLRINTRTLQTDQTPYFDIRALHRTPDGHVWIGTFGGGLLEVYNPLCTNLFDPHNVSIYNLSNGLVSDIVLAIAEDPATHDLWFTYEDGISHLSMDTRTFQHFSALETEKGAVFGEAQPLVTPAGQILFGYSFGVCRFHPGDIFHLNEVPPIRFTNFLIFNQPVTPSPDGPLSDAICYAPSIQLKHSQTVFSIEYAALAFPGETDEVRYAYKLDGVDENWNYVGTLRRATYTHLDKGTYTFRVRSTNTKGVWVDNERTLTVHVGAPLWLSWWAFLCYALILAFVIFSIYRGMILFAKLREEVAVEQKVTEIKLRFFTNISHELRTPLTLITGPVENVLKHEKISPAVRSQLEVVQSNSARMLRMINQILDFRKIQNHKMRLSVRQVDILPLVTATCANFRKEADDRHIIFTIEGNIDTPLWVDPEKVDTIGFNLLSNAFKYTEDGGAITVRIGQRGNYATIAVADNGVGIPKEKRGLLFERFTSQKEIHGSATKTGTGIGLNLVKDLVDLHHGFIEVESESGKGSTFTVLFPLGKQHFDKDEADIIIDDLSSSDAPPQPNPDHLDNLDRLAHLDRLEGPAHQATSPSGAPTVLIVDDNEDMCRFLKSCLEPSYRVLTAYDGLQALNLIKTALPDMIVTDLMMPQMDGLELTDRVKTDPATSHIPVILLTAKAAVETRLEALRYGADDYITKPFSPDYLLARISNILRQREALRESYRRNLLNLSLPSNSPQGASTPLITSHNHSEQPAGRLITSQTAHRAPQPPSPDEVFLARLLDFMERNMDNSDLTVDDLVREVALGRTVFFNKLKSLTGLSPVEFIRDVRIRRAAQLLEQGNYNVTEITYMVGMNDSRYFAKCFKAAYGQTPTDYRKAALADSDSDSDL